MYVLYTCHTVCCVELMESIPQVRVHQGGYVKLGYPTLALGYPMLALGQRTATWKILRSKSLNMFKPLDLGLSRITYASSQ